MWNKLTGFARRNKAEGSESRLREPRTGNTTIAIETAREVLTARRLERTFCAELLGVSSFINSVNPLEPRVMKRVDRVCSPDHFIIGGGTSKRFDLFRDALTVATPIHVAKFLNNAGIIGAAVAAAQRGADSTTP